MIYVLWIFLGVEIVKVTMLLTELMNLKIPLQYKNKPYVISMQTDEVYRHKLQLFQIDLIKMYCKNARFEFNNRDHKMFQQFMESFEDVNKLKSEQESEQDKS